MARRHRRPTFEEIAEAHICPYIAGINLDGLFQKSDPIAKNQPFREHSSEVGIDGAFINAPCFGQAPFSSLPKRRSDLSRDS